MHGGAKGSGAPIGNTNALKHGGHTKEAQEARARLRAYIREADARGSREQLASVATLQFLIILPSPMNHIFGLQSYSPME